MRTNESDQVPRAPIVDILRDILYGVSKNVARDVRRSFSPLMPRPIREIVTGPPAFRVDGVLDSICRVSRVEHGIPIIDVVPAMRNINKEWAKIPCTIWHFEPPVKLAKPIRTGGGMYNHRVRCALDLLLSCNTVQEIEDAMSDRRRHGES